MTQTATVQQTAATSLDILRANTTPAIRPEETAQAVGFYDGPGYSLLRAIAKDFATSDIIPQRFQGKPANCMIAVNMASRMNADPLMVMQNLYIVHGTPSWSSQFLISCFNQCGRFDSIQYEFTGEKGKDSWGCRAWATDRRTGTRVVGSEVTIAIAKAEGWYGKNGSKWQTMPEQMLRYRAAAWMIRAHAPELGMGFHTREEIIDMQSDQDGVYTVTSEDIAPPSPEHEEKMEKKAAPKAEAPEVAPHTVPCPERDGKPVDELDCPSCAMRDGCPAWDD